MYILLKYLGWCTILVLWTYNSGFSQKQSTCFRIKWQMLYQMNLTILQNVSEFFFDNTRCETVTMSIIHQTTWVGTNYCFLQIEVLFKSWTRGEYFCASCSKTSNTARFSLPEGLHSHIPFTFVFHASCICLCLMDMTFNICKGWE